MRSVLGVPLGLLWIRSGRSRERRCISSSTMTRSLSLESEPAFHVYAPTVPVKSNISNARQQGMEVLGGIASFIAIGQALAAVPTIISVVRSVSNSREELQDLIFEVRLKAKILEATHCRLTGPQAGNPCGPLQSYKRDTKPIFSRHGQYPSHICTGGAILYENLKN